MGGWTGEGRDTKIWEGVLKARDMCSSSVIEVGDIIKLQDAAIEANGTTPVAIGNVAPFQVLEFSIRKWLRVRDRPGNVYYIPMFAESP